MRPWFLTLFLPVLFAGCSYSAKNMVFNPTVEPSIERALDELSTTRAGKKLVRYIEQNHLTLEYSDLKGPWAKLMPRKRKILIPRSARNSDTVVALLLARQTHIYMTYYMLNLYDILVEQDELAALIQAHLALELGFSNLDAESSICGAAILDELCPYLLDGSHRTMEVARRNALLDDPEYRRPLESISTVTIWLKRTQKAVIDGSLARLLYERDFAKVTKNTLTMAEAVRNDAEFRALPPYEVFRVQRELYQTRMKMVSNIKTIYRSGIKADASWRRKHTKKIQEGLNEFSSCTLK